MPLLTFLRSYRQSVAHTSRANLAQSTEIVRCCRTIIQEVHSTEFFADKNYGSVQRVLIQAQKTLEAASANSGVCEAFKEATSSILEVSQILQLDEGLLGNIEERMNNAKNKDKHVEGQKSLRLHKHLKRLACSSADKSPSMNIDIRVRKDIDDESKQEIIEVRGKGSDTLDIVLLSMKLNKSPRMWQNLHFYDRMLPGAIKELVTQRKDRLEPLPFDRPLAKISQPSKRLVLYCLHDHESGNYIVLRSPSLRSFTNLWEITVNSTFVWKDVFGFIECAERSRDAPHARVKITEKQMQSGYVREEKQSAWPEVLREVHKSFGTASNVCWTIEAPYSSRIPSKITMPEPCVSQSTDSLSTLVSITPTLVSTAPSGPVLSVAKKGSRSEKNTRSSWFTSLVSKFNASAV
ncbi:uncharacterized protein EV420DRAFT_1496857 [Desarmillaria tabescens]|uniref:Uncharacterized protein n=1 Tax=Armillaria tabescens TaxID=1929756 RepID=A0AA39NQ95_ARMTA|nr:uncharacterized protein EV420DRAFT_1496857 [Desarmillaria tabescens]KAK0469825.1 hypothetical protein EV420DRAFT_1496857 [Desarmillaria tabescens]